MREFSNDDWCSPKVVVDILDAMGGVELDPCSNPWSIIGARNVYNKDNGDDGLVLPWTGPGEGLTYVNPPYSDPLPWMRRAAIGHGEIIVLVNFDATKAWKNFGWTADALCFFYERLKFIGDKKFSSRAPSALIYWGPRIDQFKAACGDKGKVLVNP